MKKETKKDYKETRRASAQRFYEKNKNDPEFRKKRDKRNMLAYLKRKKKEQ